MSSSDSFTNLETTNFFHETNFFSSFLSTAESTKQYGHPGGTQGLARCRKKSALGIGYIQQLKALLASCSGTNRFDGGLG